MKVNMSKLKHLNKRPSLKKGRSSQLERAVSIPQLRQMNVKNQSIENVKRIMEQSNVAEDQGPKAKDDDKRTWKIVIGVGLGIGLVTAIGYYALKE